MRSATPSRGTRRRPCSSGGAIERLGVLGRDGQCGGATRVDGPRRPPDRPPRASTSGRAAPRCRRRRRSRRFRSSLSPGRSFPPRCPPGPCRPGRSASWRTRGSPAAASWSRPPVPGHFIHRARPDLVIAAIRRVVEAAGRNRGRRLHPQGKRSPATRRGGAGKGRWGKCPDAAASPSRGKRARGKSSKERRVDRRVAR